MPTASAVKKVVKPILHPALLQNHEQRGKSLQNRVADKITGFAGSMVFVYVHIVWFAIWIVMNTGLAGKAAEFDPFPFGLLTMIVSLEAIYLSTFVMISQNRADAKREALATHEWQLVQQEEIENRELIKISQQILDLTKAVHEVTVRTSGAGKSAPKPS